MVNQNDWRCPNCNRFLGKESGNNQIEVESKNGQKLKITYQEKEAFCKCGIVTTIKKDRF